MKVEFPTFIKKQPKRYATINIYQNNNLQLNSTPFLIPVTSMENSFERLPLKHFHPNPFE